MQGPSGSPGNVTINAEGLGFSHNNTPACATAIGEKWKRHALDVCSLFFFGSISPSVVPLVTRFRTTSRRRHRDWCSWRGCLGRGYGYDLRLSKEGLVQCPHVLIAFHAALTLVPRLFNLLTNLGRNVISHGPGKAPKAA